MNSKIKNTAVTVPEIMRALEEATKPMCYSDIAKATGSTCANVQHTMNKLFGNAEWGRIKRSGVNKIYFRILTAEEIKQEAAMRQKFVKPPGQEYNIPPQMRDIMGRLAEHREQFKSREVD